MLEVGKVLICDHVFGLIEKEMGAQAGSCETVIQEQAGQLRGG
jgi:hypothetical protein